MSFEGRDNDNEGGDITTKTLDKSLENSNKKSSFDHRSRPAAGRVIREITKGDSAETAREKRDFAAGVLRQLEVQ
jgi:hypothetical protein